MIDRVVGQQALEILSQGVGQAVIGCDEGGQICLMNSAAERVLDGVDSAFLGRGLQDVLGAHAQRDALLPLAEQVVDGAALAAGQVVLSDQSIVPILIIRAAKAPETASGGEDSFLKQLGKTGDIRDMIHNVKGPISAAKSLIDLANVEELPTAKRNEFLERAQSRLAAAITMINQVLDIAWLGNDGELNCTTTNLNDIIQHSVRDMEGYAQHSGVTLQCEFEQTLSPVWADQSRLMGVMGNLISNAIKYSPNGGIVQVCADQDGDRVRVRVIDHGIGIEAKHLEHLWDPYYRVRSPQTQRIEGSGLGLSVVKVVIEKHGGEVFVSSVPGEGSTFGFWLPQAENE